MAKLQIDGVTVAEIPLQDAKMILQAAESYGPLEGAAEISTDVEVFAQAMLRGTVSINFTARFATALDMGGQEDQ